MVDALSTAIVMRETGIINQMLDHIAKIDFTTTAMPDDRISVFETNIRYLGGLISGMVPVPARPPFVAPADDCGRL